MEDTDSALVAAGVVVTNNALAAGVVATNNPTGVGAIRRGANGVPFEPKMLSLLDDTNDFATVKWGRRARRSQGLNPDAVGWHRKVVEIFPSAGDLINKMNQSRLAGPAATFIRIFPTSDDFVSFLLDSIVMAINQDPRLLTWIGSQSQETLANMASKIVSNISTSLRSDSFFCDLGLNGSNRMFVNQAVRIVNETFAISPQIVNPIQPQPINQIPQPNNLTINPTLPAPLANEDEALLLPPTHHQAMKRLLLLINMLPYKEQVAILSLIWFFVRFYLTNTVLPIDHFSYLTQPAY